MSLSWPFIGNATVGLKVAELLEAGSLPSMVCFVGPAGTGKRTAACWFAQRDICRRSSRPCGDCADCRRVNAGQHERLLLIDTGAEADSGIDAIRAMFQSLQYVRTERVWVIIPNIDRLSESAQNAFLKFLEEPPDHVQVLCTTTNGRLMKPTLRSRLAFYQWSRVATDELRQAFPSAPIEELRLAYGRPGALIRNLANPRRAGHRAKAKELVAQMFSHQALADKYSEEMESVYPIEELILRDMLLRDLGLMAPEGDEAPVPVRDVVGRLHEFLQYPLWVQKNLSPKTIYAHLHSV